MVTSISVVTVVGLALYLAILLVQWWFKKTDQKVKDAAKLIEDKNELEKQGINAVQKRDRGGLIDFLRRLRNSQ